MKQFLNKLLGKKSSSDSVQSTEQHVDVRERYPIQNDRTPDLSVACEDRRPASSQNAADIIANGSCGNTTKWTFYKNGELVISGNGSMNDYLPNTYEDGKKVAPWYSHCANIRSIKIEKGVSHIGKWAFAYCRNLVNVTFDGRLDELPWGSFAFAEKLERITIPNGVSRIAADVFMDCHLLRSVVIPNGVQEIGESAFYNCYALAEINLPNTLTDIDSYAFAFCGQLTRLRIPRSVSYIHEKAFYKSGVRR